MVLNRLRLLYYGIIHKNNQVFQHGTWHNHGVQQSPEKDISDYGYTKNNH